MQVIVNTGSYTEAKGLLVVPEERPADSNQEYLEAAKHSTEDPLFNVKKLKETLNGNEFDPTTVADVYQNIYTALGETNITRLVPEVVQHYDPITDNYMSFGESTVSTAQRGLNAIKLTDDQSFVQMMRESQQLAEEIRVVRDLAPELKQGRVSVFISPPPSLEEMDQQLAKDRYGYDGRTMIRMQTISSDGQTKHMFSASVFGVTNEALHSYYEARAINVENKTSSIELLEASNSDQTYQGNPFQVLGEVLGVIADFSNPINKSEILKQRQDMVSEQQADLRNTAHYYTNQELEFCKQLALSEKNATPAVAEFLDNLKDGLSIKTKAVIGESYDINTGGYHMSEELSLLALNMKMETNRGLASLQAKDERITTKLKLKLNQAELDLINETENMVRSTGSDAVSGFAKLSNERAVASANIGCEGGCAVSVKGQFDKELLATANGLVGEIFITKEINCRNPKCHPGSTKGVLVDWSGRKLCLDCGESDKKLSKQRQVKTSKKKASLTPKKLLQTSGKLWWQVG